MQLAQAGGAVAAEDGDARGTEAAASDRLRPVDGRRHGTAIDIGRSPPVAPRHDGVQLVAQHAQRVDERPALEAQVEQLDVEAPESMDECVALELSLDPHERRQARGATEEEVGRPGVARLSLGERVPPGRRPRRIAAAGVGEGVRHRGLRSELVLHVPAAGPSPLQQPGRRGEARCQCREEV